MNDLKQPLTLLIKIYPSIDQITNLEPDDHVNLGKLLDNAWSIKNRILWLENEPLPLSLLTNPLKLLFKMFTKLSENQTLKLEEKCEIEKLLICTKWFCEKVQKSSDDFPEPMDVD